MADTIKVFGHQVKKPVAAGLGVGAVLVAVIVYKWRKSQALGGSASSAASTPAAADTAAASSAGDGTTGNPNDPNSIDPATGETYGQEESANGGFGSGFSPFDFGFPTGGGGGQPTAGGFTSNGEWSQAAEAYITGNGGNAETVGNALGKYITGQKVTADQQSLIEQAIAFEGYPPVNGPDNFPPSIRLEPAPKSGGGGGKHKPAKPAHAPSGLAAHVSGTSVTLTWHKVAEATEYELTVDRQVISGPRHQVRNVKTFSGHVKGESHKLGNLARKSKFTWQVAAVNSAGTGPKSAEQHFETK